MGPGTRQQEALIIDTAQRRAMTTHSTATSGPHRFEALFGGLMNELVGDSQVASGTQAVGS